MRDMTGVLLLCLLGSVLGQENWTYSWNGPGQTDAPRPTNLCLTDPSSCSCCVMQKKMWGMEQYFNSSLDELQDKLQRTQNILNDIRASRTAFSVALTDWRRCVGPAREETIVAYQSVFINLGGAYDTTSGLFTAPRAGVYSLALTVYSDAGSPGARLAVCASLCRNGVAMASLRERNRQDQEDTATVVLGLQLRRLRQAAPWLLPLR